jgi:hypothetical protein
VVQVIKQVNGVLLPVNQRGDQNRELSIVFNADQAQFQSGCVQSHLPAPGHGSGMNGHFNDLFR